MYYKTIIFLFLIIGNTFIIKAQRSEAEKSVKAMFEKKTKWVKSYKGKLGEFTDVLITLGQEDEIYKGQILFLRSKETLQLEGILKEKKIQLEEFNPNKQRTGFWSIEIKEDQLFGLWMDNSQTKGLEILAELETSELIFPQHCGVGNWTRVYQGRFLLDKVQLSIQKEGKQLFGHLYELDNKRLMNFEGLLLEDGSFDIPLQINGNIVGSILGTLEAGTSINIERLNPTGKKSKGKFRFKQELTQGCMDYADFLISYNLVYPKSKNAAFNKYIGDLTEPWRIACREQSAILKIKNKKYLPELRAAHDAYSYYRIDNLTEDLISGVIFYQSTWSEKREEIYFNFSFKNEKPMDYEQVFNKGTIQAVKGIVSNEWEKSTIYTKRQLNLWGDRAALDYYTLVPGGFLFYARYNPIFGHPSIYIPVEKLKPYLKS